MFHVHPIVVVVALTGSTLTAIGITLTMMAREANLASTLLNTTASLSTFAKTSLLVAAKLRSYGIYPYEVAIPFTFIGTLLLTRIVVIATGSHKSRLAKIAIIAAPILLCIWVAYVGIPSFSTSNHQVSALST